MSAQEPATEEAEESSWLPKAIPDAKNKCETWAETNCVTRFLGGIGFDVLRKHRRIIFRLSAVAVFTSMILTCIAAVALSSNENTLMDFPWSHAKGDIHDVTAENQNIKGELFVGLSGMIRDLKYYNVNGSFVHERIFEGYFAFSKLDDNCDSKYCKGCQDAAEECISTVIIALILSIPTLLSDISRTSVKEDSNLEKVIGFLGGILGGVADLIALSAFVDSCVTVLPEHISANGRSVHVVWEAGIGVKCLIAATSILILDGIIHLLVPAPQLELDEEGKIKKKYDFSPDEPDEHTPLKLEKPESWI